MHFRFLACDGETWCGGPQPLRKLNRIYRKKIGKAGAPTGHPTKKHTRGRQAHFDEAKAQRLTEARFRYEALLNRLLLRVS